MRLRRHGAPGLAYLLARLVHMRLPLVMVVVVVLLALLLAPRMQVRAV